MLASQARTDVPYLKNCRCTCTTPAGMCTSCKEFSVITADQHRPALAHHANLKYCLSINEALFKLSQNVTVWQAGSVFQACMPCEHCPRHHLKQVCWAGEGTASPLQQMFQDVPVECLMVDALIQPAEGEPWSL